MSPNATLMSFGLFAPGKPEVVLWHDDTSYQNIRCTRQCFCSPSSTRRVTMTLHACLYGRCLLTIAESRIKLVVSDEESASSTSDEMTHVSVDCQCSIVPAHEATSRHVCNGFVIILPTAMVVGAGVPPSLTFQSKDQLKSQRRQASNDPHEGE